MCKPKTTYGNMDRSDCSVPRTDSFVADLQCLSTSHSATDCRKIGLILRQEPFGCVSLQLLLWRFDRIENFPEICINKHQNELSGVWNTQRDKTQLSVELTVCALQDDARCQTDHNCLILNSNSLSWANIPSRSSCKQSCISHSNSKIFVLYVCFSYKSTWPRLN